MADHPTSGAARGRAAELAADHGVDDVAELAAYGLTDTEAEQLLDLAERAIRDRLAGRPAPATERTPEGSPTAAPTPDPVPGGAFVTLHVAGRLNGCIGHLGESSALAVTVSELAVKAAFHDPRLPELQTADLHDLRIEISLLSPSREVPARSRAELFEHLRVHEHGLVLASGRRRALFLPDVWQQLPDPDDFVDHLLRKAGLRADRWPDDLTAEVFTTAAVRRELR